MNSEFVEQVLAQLRAQRDEVPHGALRNAYNDACDRLAVLSSKIARPPEKWEDEAVAAESRVRANSVKPLAWRHHNDGNLSAPGVRSDYWVTQFPLTHPYRAGEFMASNLGVDAYFYTYHRTVEEAQGSAQAHYEQRVRALLKDDEVAHG